MFDFSISHGELYEVYKAEPNYTAEEKAEAVLLYIVQKKGLVKQNAAISDLRIRLRKSFFNNLLRRLSDFKKIRKNGPDFETEYSSWLQNNFSFSFSAETPRPENPGR